MASPTYNFLITPQNINAFTASLDTNGEAKQLVKNFISSTSSFQSGGVPGEQFGPSADPESLGAAQFGLIPSGSTISVDGSHSSSFLVEANSTVDFDSHAADMPTVSFDIIVGSGSNNINLNDGPSFIQGTDGNDTFMSGGGMDTLNAGSGADSIIGGGESAIQGGSGSDTLTGGLTSAAHDTITGGSGPTVISVKHGQNEIHGGSGPETITAGNGQDTIFAGSGPETINGGTSTTIFGGGHSLINAGSLDTIQAGGSDTVLGGAGSSTVSTVMNSHSSIVGGSGHMDVTLATGGGANDSIFGGTGGLTINVQQNSLAVLSENTKDASGNTIIKFTSGQELHVNNVTVVFQSGPNPTQQF